MRRKFSVKQELPDSYGQSIGFQFADRFLQSVSLRIQFRYFSRQLLGLFLFLFQILFNLFQLTLYD